MLHGYSRDTLQPLNQQLDCGASFPVDRSCPNVHPAAPMALTAHAAALPPFYLSPHAGVVLRHKHTTGATPVVPYARNPGRSLDFDTCAGRRCPFPHRVNPRSWGHTADRQWLERKMLQTCRHAQQRQVLHVRLLSHANHEQHICTHVWTACECNNVVCPLIFRKCPVLCL